MGLFGYQKTRKKRVGIAEENDLGSFSGLEVAIDTADDEDNVFETKKNFRFSGKQETDKELVKKPKDNKSKTLSKLFKSRKFGNHEKKNKNKNHHQLPLSHQNHGCNYGKVDSSGSSDFLSVYTSSYNEDGHIVSSLPRANGNNNSGWIVTLDHVSDLILDLETAVIVGAKRPLRALKMLLALSSLESRQGGGDSSTRTSSSDSSNSVKSVHETRIDMVRTDNGKLVPVLLSFLNRCMVQSKEHTLALLILGNLSIPRENKRVIAMDCNGAEILARLLCEDPSSHLLALVLVNLTYDSFSESNTAAIEVTVAENDKSKNKIDVIPSDDRKDQNGSASGGGLSPTTKELLATNGKSALVESLAFALRVSTLTREEYEKRRETIEDCNFSDDYLSPATRLSILMAKDQQLRSMTKQKTSIRPKVLPATASPELILKQLRSNEHELHQWGSIDGTIVDSDCGSKRDSILPQRQQFPQHPPPMVEQSKQVYPETAKWCLSALRNLTKPCLRDATAAHVLIKSGVFSLVVQCITTLGDTSRESTGINTMINTSASDAAMLVARMGAMELEEPSSPCSATKTAISPASVARNDQLDNNFLSASYGTPPARIASRSLSDTGAVVKGGNGVSADGKRNERECTKPPALLGPCINSPYSWESNSMQDAALSIVLNLSASCKSREYMYEPHIVKVLTMIAEYPRLMGKSVRMNSQAIPQKDRETMDFQALKARMALSYLIGSQGHFGQAKLRSSASTVQANRPDSSLVMSDSNVELLVELLANTMNHRGKEGNGGGNYLSGTFDLKCVILSLRCLLTHTSNQEKMARLIGSELNTLLMNALARFALEPSTSPMDSESSGHVVFSMYLLSNHCFEGLTFLPGMYGTPKQQQRNSSNKASMEREDHGLAANILVSYLRLSNIPPEGRHATQQLLLRLEHLNFEDCTVTTAEVSRQRTLSNVVRSADLKINYILLAKIKRVRIANRKHGPKPDPAIFRGRVLRCQKPCDWEENRLHSHRKKIEWRNPSTVSTFANALIAVQQLSYGSIKTRRSISGSIDDIAIANKIAHCARHESPGGCHNFLWAWEIDKLEKDCDDSSSITCSDIYSLSGCSCETFSIPGFCCSADSVVSELSEI